MTDDKHKYPKLESEMFNPVVCIRLNKTALAIIQGAQVMYKVSSLTEISMHYEVATASPKSVRRERRYSYMTTLL